MSEVLPPGFVGLQGATLMLACYLYGAVPFSYVFTYLLTGQKITEKGTGNVGVANAFGVGGLKAGFLSVAGEASKVLLALSLARYFFDGSLTVSLALIAVSILGASYSVFLGKGGQGGTILLWSLLLLSPYTFLAFLAGFAAAFLMTRHRRVSVVAGHALLPVEILMIDGRAPFVFFGILAAVFFILRYDPQRSDYAFYKGRMAMLRFVESAVRKRRRYLVDLKRAKDPAQFGVGASRLFCLQKAGLRVPQTHVCGTSAYDRYATDTQSMLADLRREMEDVVEKGKTYTVRSSAEVEDPAFCPFRGQPGSRYDVDTVEEAIEAIVHIWESNRADGSGREAGIGVIVQERVDAQWSGMVFTRNPVTGFDEVVVEAVECAGDASLQNSAAPRKWVYKWGKWLEKPASGGPEMEVVSEIVAQAGAAAKKEGSPLGLGWACDGERVFWLRAWPVTETEGIDVYSNRISKEFMPGIIKPLVWSINIPVVNSSWKRLLVELLGRRAEGLDTNRLARAFYYRAYFNMGVIGDLFELLGMPRHSIELVMGMKATAGERPRFRPGLRSIGFLPGLLLFALRKSMFHRNIGRFLAAQGGYGQHTCVRLDSLDERQTLRHIDGLIEANTRASYYVIVTQLLMGLSTAVLAKLLARWGSGSEQPSFAPVREQLRDIDPSYALEGLRIEYDALPEKARRRVLATPYRELSASGEPGDFLRHMEDFLCRFGNLSESDNDFSRVPYRETPESVVAMIASGQCGRQPADGVDIASLSKGLLRGRVLRAAYRVAARYRIYRERVNFLYVYGYSQFRPGFMHLAALMRSRGLLSDEEDIFYLTYDEICSIVRTGAMTRRTRADLLRRKQEIEDFRDIELPDLIVGDTPPVPLAGSRPASTLKGLAVSKGRCEGRARIVRGLQDFARVEKGDVIVIPHSDVSWTPVLARARAIVSESGGMLSHCAIVAREYNIPAVVSVPNALRIEEGATLVVDGYSGEVLVMPRTGARPPAAEMANVSGRAGHTRNYPRAGR